MTSVIKVTAAQREAAELIVERSRRRGTPVDPVVEAIARARRPSSGPAAAERVPRS